LSDYLAGCDPEIDLRGFGTVVIGNRPVPITAQLMQDLRGQKIPARIRDLKLPLLLIHSPDDETLSFRHSLDALHWTQGRSSLLTLPGSDHLLTNQPADIALVGKSILAWAERFCGSNVRPPSS
jgi:putative redox protein